LEVTRPLALLAILGVVASCRQAPATAPPAPPPASAASPYVWRLPSGIPVPIVPRDNPMSDAKVDLGRRLFYDTRVSGSAAYACASCHQQARAFTDGRARAIGATGESHAHSAMSLTNVAYNVSFGWADPSLRSLEAQVLVPMFNEHPIEMGAKGQEATIVKRFTASPEDRGRFAAAFPADTAPVSFDNLVKAIAAFERTIVSGGSPLDRYLYRDDRTALSPEALRGMTLFFSKRLRCSECHSGFNLSGPVLFEGSDSAQPLFHNNGLYNVDGRGAYPASDRGLIERTRKPSDMGKFRAPTLRNIAMTAPYMHDGSLPTLDAVISHYATGGVHSPVKSSRIRPFQMSDTERADLIAFLNSLTDTAFLANPSLGK
jgi:cytochrome c peroxidase